MSIAQSPLSTSAPCLPSVLSVNGNTTSSDEDSAHSNSHSREGSNGSDRIILPNNILGLRLPSPSESTQSHSSFREEELEGEIKRLKKVSTFDRPLIPIENSFACLTNIYGPNLSIELYSKC